MGKKIKVKVKFNDRPDVEVDSYEVTPFLSVTNKVFPDDKLWDINHISGFHIAGNFMTKKRAMVCAYELSDAIDLSKPIKELASSDNALIVQTIVSKYQF